MSISDAKLNRIDEIYKSWKGGFTRGDYAMSQIGDVLNSKYLDMNNVKIIDTETGECILECNSAIAVIER
ncbi:hypothetical protein GFC29_3119 [Anoxybacillus sp. B7M1]|uniref:hypothetical protein n=1 Tax=unclassified Anoxybacillus TaxID=2639704 RepID=UPI0005CD4A83|nr:MULTISPECIES: hypothetical protein [unclassified Anoxybacillus]ANB55505.1 hypothetical protein GFC28_2317 [Anoxybacillus sp. B2M1]ANB64554.1 hypothetical protein GFC29_3119 [Anoxybacillus sp. B7M1]